MWDEEENEDMKYHIIMELKIEITELNWIPIVPKNEKL